MTGQSALKAVVAALVVFFVTASSQASSDTHQRRRSWPQQASHFDIKGSNAPFKNQQRKLSDPLNANGAGR